MTAIDYIDDESLIPVEDLVITLTNKGYIKRVESDTYKSQNRASLEESVTRPSVRQRTSISRFSSRLSTPSVSWRLPRFLEQQVVDKLEFMEENDRIWGKKVVVSAGDSQTMQPGQIVTARKLRDENSMLKRRDMKPVEVRDAIPATSTQILQGIDRKSVV